MPSADEPSPDPARDDGEPVLVSACLLGCNCRYNAEVRSNSGIVRARGERPERWIPVCPEASLGTPRPPADLIFVTAEDGSSEGRLAEGADVLDGRARVLTRDGVDVTEAFVKGAEEALRLAKASGARRAVLKSRSPSCGRGELSSGDGGRRPGNGIAAELLLRHGIEVESADFTEGESTASKNTDAENTDSRNSDSRSSDSKNTDSGEKK